MLRQATKHREIGRRWQRITRPPAHSRSDRPSEQAEFNECLWETCTWLVQLIPAGPIRLTRELPAPQFQLNALGDPQEEREGPLAIPIGPCLNQIQPIQSIGP